jgi:hypothetical protein
LLQEELDEIFSKEEPDEICFKRNSTKLSSRRTRRNFLQGGLDEIFFKEDPTKFSSRRNKKQKKEGKIFDFIYSSFIPTAYL